MLVDLYIKKAQELMTSAAKKDLSAFSSEYYWNRAKIYLEEEILILKAKLYWALGLVDMGNKEMRDINKLKSRHVELLAFTARSFHSGEKFYKEAIRYFHNKNYDLALMEIKKAIAITSEDIKLYILCSKICRYLNNLEDAFNYIELAKNLFLQNQDASVTVTSTTVTKVDNEVENKVNTTNEENIHFQMRVPDEIVKQTNLIYNDVALKFASEGDYQRALVLFNKIIKSEIELTATILSDSNSALTTPTNQQIEISNAVMTDEIKDFVAPIDYNYYINRGDCYRALNIFKSKVDRIFNQSLDTSKGTLWPLLNTAKDLAKDNVKSNEEIMELQGLSSTNSLPVSSVGLKMMSRSSMGKDGEYSSGDDDDDGIDNEDEIEYDDSTLNQSNNDNTTNNTTRKSISINTSNTYSNDDMTDYDGNEKDQIDIDELYNHAGESKLVELLNKVGMNSDWQQFNANEGEDSLLLVSEEEEIRQEYHKAEIELENKLIAEKIRKQTMIKQEA
eukprot:gene22905-29671_t